MGEKIGHINLNAEIVPGVSAAGFSLGLSLDSALRDIKSYKTKAEEEQLISAVQNNQFWLRYDLNLKSNAHIKYTTMYYKNLVSLHFENFILKMIILNDGYLGVYSSYIRIGSHRDEVCLIGVLTYDSSEEVYFYRDKELRGIEYTFVGDYVDSIVVSN